MSAYAPPAPVRKPGKALILAEKVHKASRANEDWVDVDNLLDATECLYLACKALNLRGHESLIASLFYIESRYVDQESRTGAEGISQINPKYRWVFEQELHKAGMSFDTYETICSQVWIGVAAYKVKLREGGREPVEAVRIYNHASDPFSYIHQQRVLQFWDLVEKQ